MDSGAGLSTGSTAEGELYQLDRFFIRIEGQKYPNAPNVIRIPAEVNTRSIHERQILCGCFDDSLPACGTRQGGVILRAESGAGAGAGPVHGQDTALDRLLHADGDPV